MMSPRIRKCEQGDDRRWTNIHFLDISKDYVNKTASEGTVQAILRA